MARAGVKARVGRVSHLLWEPENSKAPIVELMAANWRLTLQIRCFSGSCKCLPYVEGPAAKSLPRKMHAYDK